MDGEHKREGERGGECDAYGEREGEVDTDGECKHEGDADGEREREREREGNTNLLRVSAMHIPYTRFRSVTDLLSKSSKLERDSSFAYVKSSQRKSSDIDTERQREADADPDLLQAPTDARLSIVSVCGDKLDRRVERYRR